MSGWKSYLFSIILGTFSWGILLQILPDGNKKALVRYISGIVLGSTLLHPFSRVPWADYLPASFPPEDSAEYYIQEGENTATEALASVIEERCEAYTLDRANALDAEIQVEISLNKDLLPEYVEVVADIPPDLQTQLVEILMRDLGIPKENQIWIWSQENNGS